MGGATGATWICSWLGFPAEELICDAGRTASSSISGTTPWMASFAVTRRGFFIQSETHWARVMLEASVVFSRGAVARGFAGGSSLFSSHGQGSCAAAPLRVDASSLGMGWSGAKAWTEVLAAVLARATPKATATSPRRARGAVARGAVARGAVARGLASPVPVTRGWVVEPCNSASMRKTPILPLNHE